MVGRERRRDRGAELESRYSNFRGSVSPLGYGTLGWLRHTRVATPRRGSCLIHHSSLKFTRLWVGSYWEEICKKIQEIYRCPLMQLSDVGQAEKHVLSIYYALSVLL